MILGQPVPRTRVRLSLAVGRRPRIRRLVAPLGAKVNDARNVAMGAVSGSARLQAAALANRPAPLTRRLASLAP